MLVITHSYCVFNNQILLKFCTDIKKWMPIESVIQKKTSIVDNITIKFQKEIGFETFLLPTTITSLTEDKESDYYKAEIHDKDGEKRLILSYLLCPTRLDDISTIKSRKDLSWFSINNLCDESISQDIAILCNEILSNYNLFQRHTPKKINKTESTLVDSLSDKLGTIMIIGAPDSGKSTLTQVLVNQAIIKGRKVGWIDADLGQTTLGPPSSIWAAIGIHEWSCLVGGEFIGSLSPAKNEAYIASSIRCLQKLLISLGVELIIIDVGGFVFGSRANKLHKYQAQLVSPNWIVALEKDNQLSMMLKDTNLINFNNLIKIPPLSNRRKRYIKERRNNHIVNLSKYFMNSKIIEIKQNLIDLWINGSPITIDKFKNYCGHIISFNHGNIPILAWLISVNEVTKSIEIELPYYYSQLPASKASIGSLFREHDGQLKHDPDLFNLSEFIAHFPESNELD